MSKVIFTVQYEIKPEKRNEYLTCMKELKLLVKAEGLQEYNLYEVKGKSLIFQEELIFLNKEAFDNYDDSSSERMDILISKLEEFKIPNSTKYATLYELEV